MFFFFFLVFSDVVSSNQLQLVRATSQLYFFFDNLFYSEPKYGRNDLSLPLHSTLGKDIHVFFAEATPALTTNTLFHSVPKVLIENSLK